MGRIFASVFFKLFVFSVLTVSALLFYFYAFEVLPRESTLQRDGLIAVGPGQSDRRSKELRLTRAGQERFAAAQNISAKKGHSLVSRAIDGRCLGRHYKN